MFIVQATELLNILKIIVGNFVNGKPYL